MAVSELEQQLLDYLKARAGEPVSRERLLSDVWGYASGVSSRTVDVTIQRLRKKIEPDPKTPRYIVTVRGKGYAYGTQGNNLKTAPSTDWPKDSGPFVGRDTQAQAIRDWMTRGSQVLTLLGPVGVGKSRLMAHVLNAVRTPHTHYVDLAGAVTLTALDTLPPTTELLALDHAENAWQALRERLAAWSRARPDLRIIVSSRRRMQLGFETVLPVGPLSTEHAEEGYRLFRQLYRPGQAADADLSKLGGLPFLLRLAADLPPGVDTEGALSAAVGPPDLPDHQRTLHAAAQTLQLSDAEREALEQVASLPGPCPTALLSTNEILANLVDVGALWARKGRVELPLTTRTAVATPRATHALRTPYVAWLDGKSPTELADQTENIEWALDAATTVQDRLAPAIALARIDRDVAGRGQHEMDALLASELSIEQRIAALRARSAIAGDQLQFAECETLLREMMSLATDAEDHRTAVLANHNLAVLFNWQEHHEKTVALINPEADRFAETHAPDLVGGLWVGRGVAFAALGDAEGARSAYNLGRALGDAQDRAHAGHNLAIIDAATGNFQRAIDFLATHQESVEDDPTWWGEAALTRAWALACLGQTKEALALAKEAQDRIADTDKSYYGRHGEQVTASLRHKDGDVVGALRAYEALAAEWEDNQMQKSMTMWRALACMQLGARSRAERLVESGPIVPGLRRLVDAFIAGQRPPADWTEGVGFTHILEGRLVETLFRDR